MRREREAFSPRDSILNATRNRENLSLQSRFYTPPPRFPVTIFTVMITGCKIELLPAFLALLRNLLMDLRLGGGGVIKKTVAPKIPRVVCLSHPCTFRHSSEGRQIRPAELGEF